MVTVGFEPTKHNAHDLKSCPFDQARERYLTITNDTFSSVLLKVINLVSMTGFEPVTFRLEV